MIYCFLLPKSLFCFIQYGPWFFVSHKYFYCIPDILGHAWLLATWWENDKDLDDYVLSLPVILIQGMVNVSSPRTTTVAKWPQQLPNGIIWYVAVNILAWMVEDYQEATLRPCVVAWLFGRHKDNYQLLLPHSWCPQLFPSIYEVNRRNGGKSMLIPNCTWKQVLIWRNL
jgi:hypothetical protein